VPRRPAAEAVPRAAPQFPTARDFGGEAMSCMFKTSGLYSRMRLGAILLAAGESKRMNGVTKLAAEIQGVPLLKRALFALSAAGVDEVAVVLGHDAERLDALISAFPLTVVRNERYRDGQMSSVRAGLAALQGEFNAVLVCPADMPLLNAQDIQALIGAFKKRASGAAVVPRVGGRRGNPVVMDWAAREEILAGGADFGCRQFIDRNADRVTVFDSDNDHYIVDLDSPADVQALEARLSLKLKLPEAATGVAA
jgi:molybdenum cofactor cytidylyltransferase